MEQLLRQRAESIWTAAIRSVLPDEAVRHALEHFHPQGRVFLVAAGKAAWQMAHAALAVLGCVDGGIVITKYGHVRGPLPGVTCCEAGHPVPDDNSFAATQRALALVSGLRADDTVLFLLSGGGSALQPGEMSLADNGVLFLDELPEFSPAVLETMRQPLEDGSITISRATGSVTYPSRFMLVCAMNPCKCGWYGHPSGRCRCSQKDVEKYVSKISGPLLDRIDIQIEIIPVPFDKISDQRRGESSETIRERVIKARQIQEKRYAEYPGIYCNAQMNSKLLSLFARPDDKGLTLLKNAMDRLNLSARAYDRILKVSRTIADLEGSEQILSGHLAEAISYRNLDRENWAG